MRDKAAVLRGFEDRLRADGSSLAEIMNNPDLKIPVPPEAGHVGRYYYIIRNFALVVREETREPVASVPTDTALLTLLRYAPEDAKPLAEYTRTMGQSHIKTLTRRDVYYPLDVDMSSPHLTQSYNDPLGTVWTVSRTTDGMAAVMRGTEEVGRYQSVDAAEDDHELPVAVVNLCDEVLATY